MADCRVEIQEGSEPVIVIAPHAPEEDYTGAIAEMIAEKLDAYAVINKGWERDDHVDYLRDRANCNDIRQLISDDVVKDEFLMPIIRFVQQIRKQNFINVYIAIIHGFGIMTPCQDKPDIILGTGYPDRLSCDLWRRDALAYYLTNSGLNVREGSSGGKFGGWSRNNLNQLFKQKTSFWYKDNSIHSFQIEIEHLWRKSRDTARVIGGVLWQSIGNLVDLGDEGFTKKIDLQEW